MTEDEARSRPRAVDENPVARREASRRLRPIEDAPLPEKVEKSRRLNVMRAGDAPLPSPPTTLPPEWLPPKADPLRPQAFVPAADPEPSGAEVATPTPPTPGPSRAVIAAAAAAAVAIVVMGVAIAVAPTTPVLASARFSHADQLVLAEVWKARGVASWGGPHPSASLQAAVDGIARPVMAGFGAAAPGTSSDVVVVVAPGSIHGFALPDGTVVLTTGLLWRLESDAELAAVIAHLAAHQRLGHVALLLDEPPALAARAGAALAVPAASRSPDDIDVMVAVASVAATAHNTGEFERDADALATTALTRAGYDASALARVVRHTAPPAALGLQHPAPPLRLGPLSTLPTTGRVDVEPYQTRIRAVLDRRRTPSPTPTTPAIPMTAAPTTPAPAPTPVVAPAVAVEPQPPARAPPPKKKKPAKSPKKPRPR